MPTAEEYAKMSDSEKKKEDWMNSKWRPMMGWMYMVVCICDFVLFPVLWSMTQAIMHHSQMTQWNPLTLQGAGLFHIAMGAVLGLAAWGRTQEKLGGANNGGLNVPSSVPSTIPPAPATPSFGSTSSAPSGSGFGGTTKPATPSFGSSSAAPTGQVGFSSSGKAMPVQPDQPEI